MHHFRGRVDLFILELIENMTIMKNSVILFLLTLVAACATGSKFIASEDPTDSTALVYIYRPSNFTNALINPEIIIDKNNYVKITNGGYVFTYLEEGEYQVGVDFGDKKGEKEKSFKFENGKTYFIKVTTGRKALAYPYTLVYFKLDNMDTVLGQSEIIETRLLSEIKH